MESNKIISDICSIIRRDMCFDYSSIEIKKDLKNNSLYLTVKDRYDTIKIEILPNKNIYMGDKIYQYTTCSDIMKIFREG